MNLFEVRAQESVLEKTGYLSSITAATNLFFISNSSVLEVLPWQNTLTNVKTWSRIVTLRGNVDVA